MDDGPEPRPGTIDRAVRLIAAVGLAGLIALAVLTVADVLLRWLFSAPIDGAGEIAKLLIAVVIAAFFPAALAERQHIVIDFAKLLGPRIDRALAVFADIVTLAFFAAVAWRFVLYTAELARSGETTWILGWPVAPWWIAVTALVAVCLPVQAAVLRRTARRGSKPTADGGPDDRGGAA
ncbi:MAG: TRAP transporter small permease [Rhodospirillales bacterium]